MSMGMALEGTRDYLRTQQSWTYKEIGIQFRNLPPAVAPQAYVALDDGGVSTQRSNDYFLRESLTITIGVWRRMSEYPKDVSGQLLIPSNIYQPLVKSLEDLERLVIDDLHTAHALTSAINTQFSLPDATLGDKYTGHLSYTGRTTNETLALPESPDVVFIGRRLRFQGLTRLQPVSGIG